jgi:hypothetical protein
MASGHKKLWEFAFYRFTVLSMQITFESLSQPQTCVLLGSQLSLCSIPVSSPQHWSTLPPQSRALPSARWRLRTQFGFQCRLSHVHAPTLCRSGLPLVHKRRIVHVKFALPLSETGLPPIATRLPSITTGLPSIATSLPPIATSLLLISVALLFVSIILPLDATTFLLQSRPSIVAPLPSIVFVLSWSAIVSWSTLPSFLRTRWWTPQRSQGIVPLSSGIS